MNAQELIDAYALTFAYTESDTPALTNGIAYDVDVTGETSRTFHYSDSENNRRKGLRPEDADVLECLLSDAWMVAEANGPTDPVVMADYLHVNFRWDSEAPSALIRQARQLIDNADKVRAIFGGTLPDYND